jgi:hypothetical protein
MVTGAVPVDVNVTGSVVAVFTVTLPNATLVGLIVNVGPVNVDPAALSCRAKFLETVPALAVSVTACADVTDDTLAVNPALVALAGTVIVAGTVAAALLLARLTLKPPLPAAAVSVTVQLSLPGPVIDALLQESALNAPSAVPEGVELTTAVPQPDSATARLQANMAHSSAHKHSILRIGPRLQAKNEPDTGVTSVNLHIFQRQIEKNYR